MEEDSIKIPLNVMWDDILISQRNLLMMSSEHNQWGALREISLPQSNL